MWLWLWLLLASCGARCRPDDGCAACVGPESRDLCLYDRLQATPADRFDIARDAAAAITDPVVRGAGVSSWIEQAGRQLSRSQQESLCQLLDGSAGEACRRRAASPHLQR